MFSMTGYFFAGSKPDGRYTRPQIAVVPSRPFAMNGCGGIQPASRIARASPAPSSATTAPSDARRSSYTGGRSACARTHTSALRSGEKSTRQVPLPEVSMVGAASPPEPSTASIATRAKCRWYGSCVASRPMSAMSTVRARSSTCSTRRTFHAPSVTRRLTVPVATSTSSRWFQPLRSVIQRSSPVASSQCIQTLLVQSTKVGYDCSAIVRIAPLARSSATSRTTWCPRWL